MHETLHHAISFYNKNCTILYKIATGKIYVAMTVRNEVFHRI